MSKFTVLPETVHIAVVCELKLTGSPEDALALSANPPLDSHWSGKGPNVMT